MLQRLSVFLLADEVLNLETAPETQTQAALPPASFRPLSVPSNAEQSVASKEKALGLFNMTAKVEKLAFFSIKKLLLINRS